MNIKSIKKLSLAIPVALLVFLTGCLKEHDGFIDFTKTEDFVILTGAGMGNFKAANLQMSSDTVKRDITVNLASANNDNGPVTVTLGVDPSAATIISSYNTANNTKFQLMPTTAYKLGSTQVTVPAGQHYATTTLEVYKSKLDPSISYMLPISITNGGGKNLSSNQNTIYYNVIGNPIAGNYMERWRRWNAADTSGAPTYDFSDPTVFSPESATQVLVESAENGAQFHISFTNTNGVLSNFKVTLDPASWSAFGAGAISTAPVLQVADPIKGYYRIYYSYTLASNGAARSIIEEFTKM